MYSDTRGREHRNDAAMRGYNFSENALALLKWIACLLLEKLYHFQQLIRLFEFWTKSLLEGVARVVRLKTELDLDLPNNVEDLELEHYAIP